MIGSLDILFEQSSLVKARITMPSWMLFFKEGLKMESFQWKKKKKKRLNSQGKVTIRTALYVSLCLVYVVE